LVVPRIERTSEVQRAIEGAGSRLVLSGIYALEKRYNINDRLHPGKTEAEVVGDMARRRYCLVKIC
jgi:hypothetical protein